MQTTKNLSLRYECDISEVSSLFSDQSLGYIIESYFCRCSTRFFRIKQSHDDTKLDSYICDCGCDEFVDIKEFSNGEIWDTDTGKSLLKEFKSSFSMMASFDKKLKIAHGAISIRLPKTLDFIREKLIFDNLVLYKISIQENGNEKKESILSESGIELIFSKIVELKKELLNFIKTNGVFEHRNSALKKSKNLKELQFFLQHPHLQDYEFLKWKNILTIPQDKALTVEDALNIIAKRRDGKSLRRAVFVNYNYQMAYFDEYSSHFAECTLMHIKDINVARRMLEASMHKYFIDDEYIKSGVNILLAFLTKRYADKQIEKLLLAYQDKEVFWLTDSVKMLKQMKRAWLEDIPKIKCNCVQLHDSLSKYYNLMSYIDFGKVIFDYDTKSQEACVDIMVYSVKLPTSGKDLYDWSNELNNCLTSYIDTVKYRRAIIYGFFVEDKIKFAVELKDQEVVQAKAKNNLNLDLEQSRALGMWLRGYVIEASRALNIPCQPK